MFLLFFNADRDLSVWERQPMEKAIISISQGEGPERSGRLQLEITGPFPVFSVGNVEAKNDIHTLFLTLQTRK